MARQPEKEPGGIEIIPPAGRGDIPRRALGPAAGTFGAEVRPRGKEIRQSPVRSVGTILRAYSALVTGAELVFDWLEAAIEERLKGVPEGYRAEPSKRIALPAMQAIVYAADEIHIKEMFANLIAKDLTKSGKEIVHPAFVEIIKEITSLEAIVIGLFAEKGSQVEIEVRAQARDGSGFITVARRITIDIEEYDYGALEQGVSNLERLGLLVRRDRYPFGFKDDVERLLTDPVVIDAYAKLRPDTYRDLYAVTEGIYLSTLGKSFVKACVRGRFRAPC